MESQPIDEDEAFALLALEAYDPEPAREVRARLQATPEGQALLAQLEARVQLLTHMSDYDAPKEALARARQQESTPVSDALLARLRAIPGRHPEPEALNETSSHTKPPHSSSERARRELTADPSSASHRPPAVSIARAGILHRLSGWRGGSFRQWGAALAVSAALVLGVVRLSDDSLVPKGLTDPVSSTLPTLYLAARDPVTRAVRMLEPQTQQDQARAVVVKAGDSVQGVLALPDVMSPKPAWNATLVFRDALGKARVLKQLPSGSALEPLPERPGQHTLPALVEIPADAPKGRSALVVLLSERVLGVDEVVKALTATADGATGTSLSGLIPAGSGLEVTLLLEVR